MPSKLPVVSREMTERTFKQFPNVLSAMIIRSQALAGIRMAMQVNFAACHCLELPRDVRILPAQEVVHDRCAATLHEFGKYLPKALIPPPSRKAVPLRVCFLHCQIIFTNCLPRSQKAVHGRDDKDPYGILPFQVMMIRIFTFTESPPLRPGRHILLTSFSRIFMSWSDTSFELAAFRTNMIVLLFPVPLPRSRLEAWMICVLPSKQGATQ